MTDIFRQGHTLKTTIYRNDEEQPCAWVAGDPALAETIVNMLNLVERPVGTPRSSLTLQDLLLDTRTSNCISSVFDYSKVVPVEKILDLNPHGMKNFGPTCFKNLCDSLDRNNIPYRGRQLWEWAKFNWRCVVDPSLAGHAPYP